MKISIDFSGNPNKAKEVIPSFTLFDSKLSSQYVSEIKTSKKNPAMSDIAPNQRFSQEEGPVLSEAEMSKKYEHLKEKEQQLIKERERVLVTSDETAKGKGGSKSTIIRTPPLTQSLRFSSCPSWPATTSKRQLPPNSSPPKRRKASSRSSDCCT